MAMQSDKFAPQVVPFTLSQKICIVKCYYIGGESIRGALDFIHDTYGIKSTNVNVQSILEIINEFEKSGSVRPVFHYCKTPAATRSCPPLRPDVPAVVEEEQQEEIIQDNESEDIEPAAAVDADDLLTGHPDNPSDSELPPILYEPCPIHESLQVETTLEHQPEMGVKLTNVEIVEVHSKLQANVPSPSSSITCKDCGKQFKNQKCHLAHVVVCIMTNLLRNKIPSPTSQSLPPSDPRWSKALQMR